MCTLNYGKETKLYYNNYERNSNLIYNGFFRYNQYLI